MCQSSARGRRRLRRPSLVRLIAPTRHLPLPPAPPIQSPSRGEERAGGERREVSAPSYFTTRRRRERGRSSAAGAALRLGPAELWSTGGRGGRDREPRGRSLSAPGGSRRLLAIHGPAVSSSVPGRGRQHKAHKPWWTTRNKRRLRQQQGRAGLLSLTRVCPARTPLPPPVYVAGAVRDQTTAPHAPPAPLPRASPRTDVALLRQRQPAAAAAPPAAIRTSRRWGHRAAPAAPPGLLPGLPRLPGHRPGLGEGGAAGRSSQRPPEGAGLCAAVPPRLCRSPRSLPLALALLPFYPDPSQPIRGQARGRPSAAAAGDPALPRTGWPPRPARRAGSATPPRAAPPHGLQRPSDSAARGAAARAPAPPRPALAGERVPFPCFPTGGFSSLQKSTHLLRPHREGRIWLPAAVQGTRPAAPARQHGLGRRRLLLLPWAFSGLITQQRSQIFRPNAGFGASAPAPPAPGFGRSGTAPASRPALDGPGRSPGPPRGQWRGVELGFVVATKAVNADIFSIIIGVCDLKFRFLELCFPAWRWDK